MSDEGEEDREQGKGELIEVAADFDVSHRAQRDFHDPADQEREPTTEIHEVSRADRLRLGSVNHQEACDRRAEEDQEGPLHLNPHGETQEFQRFSEIVAPFKRWSLITSKI